MAAEFHFPARRVLAEVQGYAVFGASFYFGHSDSCECAKLRRWLVCWLRNSEAPGARAGRKFAITKRGCQEPVLSGE